MTKRNKNRREPIPQIGHAKEQIVIDHDVDNPHYEKAHHGEKWNPDKIKAARNLRESTFSALKGRGVIDGPQVSAALKFLRHYEALGGGAQAMDYTREPVDGGGVTDPISNRKIDAGNILEDARKHIGSRPYSIVERIIGEGYTIAQISKDHRERTTNADYLKHALDDLAALWGINQKNKKPGTAHVRSLASL